SRTRRVMRPRGRIVHPSPTQIAVPVGPPLRGRPRDVEPLSSPSNRPALIDNQPRDPQSLDRSQGSVTVGHEDLMGDGTVLRQLHSTPGRLRLPSSFRPCRHTISTNVPDQYT